MTDSKKNEKPSSQADERKTVVRLALYVDVPVELPKHVKLVQGVADDGTVIAKPAAEHIPDVVNAAKDSMVCRSVSATFGAASHMISTAHPDVTIKTDHLFGFSPEDIAQYLNGISNG